MDTKTPEVTLYKPDFSQMELQLATEIMAGFPSPADDYMHESLDLKDLLVPSNHKTVMWSWDISMMSSPSSTSTCVTERTVI